MQAVRACSRPRSPALAGSLLASGLRAGPVCGDRPVLLVEPRLAPRPGPPSHPRLLRLAIDHAHGAGAGAQPLGTGPPGGAQAQRPAKRGRTLALLKKQVLLRAHANQCLQRSPSSRLLTPHAAAHPYPPTRRTQGMQPPMLLPFGPSNGTLEDDIADLAAFKEFYLRRGACEYTTNAAGTRWVLPLAARGWGFATVPPARTHLRWRAAHHQRLPLPVRCCPSRAPLSKAWGGGGRSFTSLPTADACQRALRRPTCSVDGNGNMKCDSMKSAGEAWPLVDVLSDDETRGNAWSFPGVMQGEADPLLRSSSWSCALPKALQKTPYASVPGTHDVDVTFDDPNEPQASTAVARAER